MESAVAIIEEIGLPESEEAFFAWTRPPQHPSFRNWASNYLYFSIRQAWHLALVVRALPPSDGESLTEVTKALFEEFGSGDPDAVHSRLFRRVAAATGLSSKELEQAARAGGPSISAYVGAIEAAYISGDIARVMGAYAYLERSAVLSYPLMLAALEAARFPSDALEFFRVHVVQEAAHDAAAAQMVFRLVRTPSEIATFKAEVDRMHQLWGRFWDSLAE